MRRLDANGNEWGTDFNRVRLGRLFAPEAEKSSAARHPGRTDHGVPGRRLEPRAFNGRGGLQAHGGRGRPGRGRGRRGAGRRPTQDGVADRLVRVEAAVVRAVVGVRPRRLRYELSKAF